MEIVYYDRQGNAITMNEWSKLFTVEYKRVASDELEDGKTVSTVWLGLDHQYGDGPPLIFETMVFPPGDSYQEIEMRRYATEEEALAGHAELVKAYNVVVLHEVRDRKAIEAGS